MDDCRVEGMILVLTGGGRGCEGIGVNMDGGVSMISRGNR